MIWTSHAIGPAKTYLIPSRRRYIARPGLQLDQPSQQLSVYQVTSDNFARRYGSSSVVFDIPWHSYMKKYWWILMIGYKSYYKNSFYWNCLQRISTFLLVFAGSLVWRCWQEDLKQLRAGFQHCRAEGGELDSEGALAFTSRKKTPVRSGVSIFQLHVFLKKKNPVFMSMLLDNISKLEDINSHTNPIPPRYNCLKNSHTASRGAEFEEVVTTSWETQVHWSPVRRKHLKNDE